MLSSRPPPALGITAESSIPAGLRLGPVPGTFKLGKYLSDRREPGPKKKVLLPHLGGKHRGEIRKPRREKGGRGSRSLGGGGQRARNPIFLPSSCPWKEKGTEGFESLRFLGWVTPSF